MQKITVCMILVCISETFPEFRKYHDRLTKNVPFANHKNKYFIVQMLDSTTVHVSSG